MRGIAGASLIARAAAAALALLSVAEAHDFWIEAAPWRAEPGAPVEVGLYVGHATDRVAWSAPPARVLSFDRVTPTGVESLRDALRYDAIRKVWSGRLDAGKRPVEVYAFETNDTTSVLDAEKFDAYARDEGLTLVLARREASGAASAPGRERYSRRAKTLLAAPGAATDRTPPPLARQTLEIAPLVNPFALRADEPLRLMVLYKGAPLAGASVKFESLDSGLLPPHRRATDRSGVAVFDLPKRGAWKASVVWSEPTKNDAEADYRTVFASLTFGL